MLEFLQWVHTRIAERRTGVPCLGNAVVNDRNNGFGSFFGRNGINMSNCGSAIPLDCNICPSENKSIYYLDARYKGSCQRKKHD
jgi:hypothetical protein